MSLLVANWKMHGNRARVRDYAYAINEALGQTPAAINMVFCPPSVYLATAQAALPPNARLRLGGQDCHAAREGAYTGDISATMLYDAGARYVILGHSERRQCGDVCEDVRAKAESAMAAGLVPILCVGESLTEYKATLTAERLQKQAAHFTALETGSYYVAYEPLWAIGTGRTPKIEEIVSAHATIKSALGSETAVLYGGSVNAGNLREILNCREVQGALIGGASLEIDSMRRLMELAAKQGA